MKRFITSLVPGVLLMVFLTIPTLPAAAVDIYQISATSLNNDRSFYPASGAIWYNFTLTYKDIDNSKQFSLGSDELISFSGVVATYPNGALHFTQDTYYPTLIEVPQYNAATSPYTAGTGGDDYWGFADGYHIPIGTAYTVLNPTTAIPASGFSYVQTRVGGEVPIPPSVLLLGSGLLGLAGWRRFRKS